MRCLDQKSPRSIAAYLQPLGTYTCTQRWVTGTSGSDASSGRTSLRTIYSLIGCPPPVAASYLLVRRHTDGSCDVLGSGRAVADAPSVNLAVIRERGAKLGANEVHLAAL